MSRIGKEITFGAGNSIVEASAREIVRPASQGGLTVAPMPYLDVRKQDIMEALKIDGYDKLMPPTEIELGYVASVYENKGYTDIDKLTTKDVDNVGRNELEDLNKQLTQFTSKMAGIEVGGIFDIIDHISQEVDKTQLGEVWSKAKNAKPTILARILGLFNPQATRKSILNQFDILSQIVRDRGKSLELKFIQIEKDLEAKRGALLQNINMLQSAFQLYYNSFIQLRKQFILIRFMEWNFSKQLEVFKQQNVDSQDLVINNKLMVYERIMRDLTTRRLLLHKTLLQLPITAEQNERLITVSRSLMDEINNTLLASMPVIRMNFVGIKAALDAERAFMSTGKARELERNGSMLLSEVSGSLAERAELMYGANRLAEARCLDELVNDVVKFKNIMIEAKNKSQKDIDEASQILHNCTDKVKQNLSYN